MNTKIEIKEEPVVLREAQVEKPELSIVVSVYNTAKYVGNTILSILRQEGVNFELILVNDASPDNALEIISSFKDPRITLITLNKNHGVSNARNTGACFAKGDWLCFMDSDDLFVDGILLPYFTYVKQSGNRWGYGSIVVASRQPDQSNIIMGLPFDLVHFLERNIVPNPQIIFKELFFLAGGYSLDYFTAEDYDLSLRLIEYTTPSYFPKVITNYIRHTINSSKVKPDQKEEVRLMAMKRIYSKSQISHIEKRRELLRIAFELLDAIRASNFPKILEHSRYLYEHNVASVIMDRSLVQALIGLGKFRDAFNIALRWIKKISCGVTIGIAAQEWTIRTALETAIYLNDYVAVEALLPLAEAIQQSLPARENNLREITTIAQASHKFFSRKNQVLAV